MPRVRCITEMGMGVDVHGKDATKAAKRAVSDAIRHSSLGFFRMLGKTANDMFVDVTLGVPDPDHISSFLNFRVADIRACYELWKSRGAEFITEPKPKYGETRCYIRDPDGYIIEVGQSNPGVTYG